MTLSVITVKTMDGQEKSFGDYAGKVLLIVNVASYCAYTPQYAGLERLYKRYKEAGFLVLGFPSNDFGGQEPGTNSDIAQFCQRTYGISFDLFDKIYATGTRQHPLYAHLTTKAIPPGEVSWNFEKFLVNKTGEVVARYRSSVGPESSELIAAIEKALI
jgi:glutathione peroxidase